MPEYLKTTISKFKRLMINREEIYSTHITDKKLISLKHKELLQIIRKKSKYLIETKATTKQFTEKEMSNHIHNTNVEIKTSLR